LRRGLLSACALGVLGVALSSACAPDDKKAGLVLAVQTDMSIPKDVDTVEIDISLYGKTQFNRKFDVGETGLHIPATLTLLPPNEAHAPVTIRVLSYQNDTVRTLRRVVTTVPDNREALLRVPIQWLCEGQAEEVDGAVQSTCDEGSSCVTGSCATDEVDSAKLPDFDEAVVFGGATSDGKGVCFDTVPCIASKSMGAEEMGLNTDDCTVPLGGVDGAGGSEGGAPEKLNFALSSGEGEGICQKNVGCFIPLDHDEEIGWKVESSTVKLPEAVCEKVKAGDVRLVASTACVTKTADIPPCGPWSSVQGTTITVDLGSIPTMGLGGEGNGPLEPFTGCGDGALAASEACDDGNSFDGDGCSAVCAVEPWYLCSGAPSSCDLRPPGDLLSNAIELSSNVYSMLGAVGPNGAATPQDMYFKGTRFPGNAVQVEITASFAGQILVSDRATHCTAEECGDWFNAVDIVPDVPALIGVSMDTEDFVVRVVATESTTGTFTLLANQAESHCGDGVVDGTLGEECDDANEDYGDGCYPYDCFVEGDGWSCSGQPSVCFNIP
jgi:cysteine-rich repeat protein